ncbi:cupin domain-containing protein [Thalassobacillus sp. CUG 92003]|uniref:cupin domain-containing protein n=1 Tax=Thalassobacillus sp. CUG 92003 TaxID=2736641 RepID=UPI0015E76107|nr:cupin domain-containing protein [Thalassobacillus sp. CUG 92003]
MSAEYWIDRLNLSEHPEGGFYRPTYESGRWTAQENRERKLYTSIYFLLRSEDISHFHRLQSDELWYFHAGSSLKIHMITPEGKYEEITLGLHIENGEVPQFVVPKHTIFGSSVPAQEDYSLVGCMVSPGFDFEDFELFSQAELLEQYPQHKDIIMKMAYERK